MASSVQHAVQHQLVTVVVALKGVSPIGGQMESGFKIPRRIRLQKHKLKLNFINRTFTVNVKYELSNSGC